MWFLGGEYMDIGAIIGILIGMGGILLGYLMEAKYDFGAFIALVQPTSAAIVFGGTIGAVALSFPGKELKKLIWSLKVVFTKKEYNEQEIIDYIVSLSEKARKEGLLSLESEVQTAENQLLKRGIELVVDGVNQELVKEILLSELEFVETKYESTAKIWEAAGGYSPTMGVLGTVMGMVTILSHMGSDTNALAHSIAVAFVATMYGVMFANVFYLPFATRIKAKSQKEQNIGRLVVEGVLSIQSGENPRIIAEKLSLAFTEHTEKPKSDDEYKEEGK
ncbi:MAG TPA: motility protein A [Clostridiales bacterium]|nr:motility protein A [Clostridiales bacterium]